MTHELDCFTGKLIHERFKSYCAFIKYRVICKGEIVHFSKIVTDHSIKHQLRYQSYHNAVLINCVTSTQSYHKSIRIGPRFSKLFWTLSGQVRDFQIVLKTPESVRPHLIRGYLIWLCWMFWFELNHTSNKLLLKIFGFSKISPRAFVHICLVPSSYQFD